MAKKDLVQIYRATSSFWLGDQFVKSGDSVAAGHPLLKGRSALFEPFQPTHGSVDWGEAQAEAPAPAEVAAEPEKGGKS